MLLLLLLLLVLLVFLLLEISLFVLSTNNIVLVLIISYLNRGARIHKLDFTMPQIHALGSVVVMSSGNHDPAEARRFLWSVQLLASRGPQLLLTCLVALMFFRTPGPLEAYGNHDRLRCQ